MASSRTVKAYYASRYQRTRLLSWLAAAFDGLWLGLLRPRDLEALDEAFYQATRERQQGRVLGYADAEYTRRGLEDWEERFVTQLPPQSRVLVTGAGGGREVLALLRAGHDAVGFEPNPAFVEGGDRTLAAEGHAGRLHPMPRDGFPSVAGTFDAVIVGWGSYMSVPGRDARVSFLRAARSVLPAGGPMLVSGWYRESDTAYDLTVARIGTRVRRVLRRAPLEVGDALIDCYVHRFTREELETEVVDAGFEPRTFGSEPCAWVGAAARVA